MAEIHHPPRNVLLHEEDRLYYLAGTSLRNSSWEIQAAHGLEKNLPHVGSYIAQPRHRTAPEYYATPLFQEWEEQGLERAARNGGVILWIVADESVNQLLYAHRIDVVYGRIMDLRQDYPDMNLSVGVDTSSETTYDFLAEKEKDSPIPLHDTLDDTVHELLDKVRV